MGVSIENFGKGRGSITIAIGPHCCLKVQGINPAVISHSIERKDFIIHPPYKNRGHPVGDPCIIRQMSDYRQADNQTITED
jgi:hypothetical protein